MFIKKKTVWYKLFDSEEKAKQQIPLHKAETIRVGGKKICIAHIPDGLYAVSDRCPHQGGSLGKGWCTNEGTIVCPWHRFEFDLKTGRTRVGQPDFVYTYPIESRSNGLFIGFEKMYFSLKWKD